MKQIMLIVTLTSILSSCSSSSEIKIKENEVPPSVLSVFKAKYPSAQEVKWQAEKEDDKFFFEADFKDGGKEKEVHISPDGLSITEEE